MRNMMESQSDGFGLSWIDCISQRAIQTNLLMSLLALVAYRMGTAS
jgi:hypothetical protein